MPTALFDVHKYDEAVDALGPNVMSVAAERAEHRYSEALKGLREGGVKLPPLDDAVWELVNAKADEALHQGLRIGAMLAEFEEVGEIPDALEYANALVEAARALALRA